MHGGESARGRRDRDRFANLVRNALIFLWKSLWISQDSTLPYKWATGTRHRLTIPLITNSSNYLAWPVWHLRMAFLGFRIGPVSQWFFTIAGWSLRPPPQAGRATTDNAI